MWASGGATTVPSDHKPTPTSSTVAPPILQPNGHAPVCFGNQRCTHFVTDEVMGCARSKVWAGWAGGGRQAKQPGHAQAEAVNAECIGIQHIKHVCSKRSVPAG